jgi:hypothetical protein
MILLRALVSLLPCLAQPPVEAPELPGGVDGWTGQVREVHGKALPVTLEPGKEEGKTLLLKITDASRFTLFDGGPQADKTDKVLQHVRALGGKAKRIPTFPRGKQPDSWSIDLAGTKARDQDLLVLAGLPDLAILNLAFTAVTDDGVKHLRALPLLDDLNLTGTRATDASVATLKQLGKLRILSVAQSKITAKGIEELIRAFPDLDLCRVASGKHGHFRVLETFQNGKQLQKRLMIGDTLYAVELSRVPQGAPPDLDIRRLATTYYHRHGPVGQVLARFDWFASPQGKNTHHSDAHLPASLVGLSLQPRLGPGTVFPGEMLVGLWSEPAIGVFRVNGGTHACYGRPFQFVDFYDNTPDIQAFSVPPKGQPPAFDFIHRARTRGCQVRILSGDERPTLARKGPKQFYSALFMEISREDLRDVNTTLMTKEGMAELMGSLRENGVLCYHTSHRYHDFIPPLVDAAKSLGYAWKLGKDEGNWKDGLDRSEEHFSSEWFVVARKPAYLEFLRNHQKVDWSVPEATGRHLWRDGQPHDLKPLARDRK